MRIGHFWSCPHVVPGQNVTAPKPKALYTQLKPSPRAPERAPCRTILRAPVSKGRRSVPIEAAKFSLASGKFADAVSTLKPVLNANPNNVRALVLRGIAYNAIGEYNQSDADLTRALRLDPKNRLARITRAIRTFDTPPASGIAELQIVLRDFPDDQYALLCMAVLKWTLNFDFEAYEQGLRVILELNPKNDAALSLLALDQKRHAPFGSEYRSRAISLARKAIAVNPRNGMAAKILSDLDEQSKTGSTTDMISDIPEDVFRLPLDSRDPLFGAS